MFQLHGAAADTPSALRFYAALLSASVVSHGGTPEEWMEASGETLRTLGMKALEINGLLLEDAKKNSPIPSTASPSLSAES